MEHLVIDCTPVERVVGEDPDTGLPIVEYVLPEPVRVPLTKAEIAERKRIADANIAEQADAAKARTTLAADIDALPVDDATKAVMRQIAGVSG